VSAPALSFRTHGLPVPQGSMSGFVRGGRAVLTDQKGPKLKPWREAVRSDAVTAAGPDWRQLLGPVKVTLLFAVRRPASAPKRRRTWPITRGSDLDKLARAVLDAITDAGVIKDDSQVTDLRAIKDYPGPDVGLHVPGVTVAVYRVEDTPGAGHAPALTQLIGGITA
jgi:Holliday junction resolvase RusA-like endonuclease